jgi:phosphoribosylformimino-5-aminoimidazole carboxamide ribotide isomerase
MTAESRKGAPFAVIPAVDVIGDEAVRLEQGDFDRVTLRAGGPEQLVARYASYGPPWIHVVDLGGARSGRVRPALVVGLVRAAGRVPVQASGGIRSLADAETLLAAGAARVVVGTAAFADDDSLDRLAQALQDRLVVALDARDGRIAVRGWERSGGLSVAEAAVRCREAGVHRLHCTAIERDGTLAGPDLELLAEVRDTFGTRIVAAGGIRSTSDLDRLAELGIEGAVVGRALLEGTLPLTALGGAPRLTG